MILRLKETRMIPLTKDGNSRVELIKKIINVKTVPLYGIRYFKHSTISSLVWSSNIKSKNSCNSLARRIRGIS